MDGRCANELEDVELHRVHAARVVRGVGMGQERFPRDDVFEPVAVHVLEAQGVQLRDGHVVVHSPLFGRIENHLSREGARRSLLEPSEAVAVRIERTDDIGHAVAIHVVGVHVAAADVGLRPEEFRYREGNVVELPGARPVGRLEPDAASFQEVELAVSVDVARAETVKPAAATVLEFEGPRDGMKRPGRGGIGPVGLPISPRLNRVTRFARSQDFGLSVARHVGECFVLALHVRRDLVLRPVARGPLGILVPIAGSEGDGILPSEHGPDVGRRNLNDVVPPVAADVVAVSGPRIGHARVDLDACAGDGKVLVSVAVNVLAGSKVVVGAEGARIPAPSRGDVEGAVVVEVADGDAFGEETVVKGELGVREVRVSRLGTARAARPAAPARAPPPPVGDDASAMEPPAPPDAIDPAEPVVAPEVFTPPLPVPSVVVPEVAEPPAEPDACGTDGASKLQVIHVNARTPQAIQTRAGTMLRPSRAPSISLYLPCLN